MGNGEGLPGIESTPEEQKGRLKDRGGDHI
jgi:hypothetical protein